MKYNLAIVILFALIFILSQGCDPVSVRDCGTFEYDISNWSITDDTVSSKLIFLDKDLKELEFHLIDTQLSEPYEAFETGALTPDDVGCLMTKSNIYKNDESDTELAFTYSNFEIPANNRPIIYFYLEIKNSKSDTFIRTQPIYFKDTFPGNLDDVIEEIAFAGQIYNDVGKFKVVGMLNSITMEFSSDTIFRNLYFKPPIGLVQIEFLDGTKLIKRNE